MELFSTRAFPVHGMDGESIRMDGELFGRWPWCVLIKSFDRWFNYYAVDWTSYGEVLQASSRIMDSIAYHVTTLSKTGVMHLPILVAENIEDSKYVSWEYAPA
jgi:hypothetical protein